MTQLERELKQTLRVQEELFKSELEKVTRQYVRSLEDCKTSYNQIVSGQQTIIEGQSEELKLYEKASRNIRIRLDDSQVTVLTEQVEDLKSLLNKQEEEYQSLATAFETLASGLEKLERKL